VKRHCPVCGSQAETRLFSEFPGYQQYYCLHCTVIFTVPMESLPEQGYEDFYFQRDETEWARLLSHQRYVLKFISRRRIIDENSRVFEIGCGCGSLLYYLEKKFHCQCTGIDINEKAIRIGKERLGLTRLYPLSVEEFIDKTRGELFDLVIFTEVIEHVADPSCFINSIKKLMCSNGRIVCTVPNRDRAIKLNDERDIPPHHLTLWDKKSLAYFLSSNGIQIEGIFSSPSSLAIGLTHLLFSRFLGTGLLGGAVKEARAGSEEKKARLAAFTRAAYYRNRFFETLFLPLAYVLHLFGWQGMRLVCLGRLIRP